MGKITRTVVVTGAVALSLGAMSGTASAHSCQSDAVSLWWAKYVQVGIGQHNSTFAQDNGGLHFGPDGSSWVKACR